MEADLLYKTNSPGHSLKLKVSCIFNVFLFLAASRLLFLNIKTNVGACLLAWDRWIFVAGNTPYKPQASPPTNNCVKILKTLSNFLCTM